MFTIFRVVLLASFVSMTLGAGIVGAAENRQAAPDVAALQAEIARLKAEVAMLQAKLDEAQKINAELAKKMAAQPGDGTPNPVAIPRDGTEVSLSQILADRNNYCRAQTALTVIGAVFIETDAVAIGNVITFHLCELRPDKKEGRLSAIVLVPIAISKPLIDAVGNATVRGYDAKLVRLKVRVMGDMVGESRTGDLTLHVDGYQLLDATSNTWGPRQWEPVEAAKPGRTRSRPGKGQ